MTAEPDLLPLRDWMECLGEINAEDIRDYARACVARATAARDAEIEALRAERDAAFRMSRCECASDECCANLVKHQQRAEQLAEALRDAAYDIDAGVPPEDAAAHLRARADLLRDQEEGK